MYTLKPMTERVKSTREKYRTTVPRVDISRYRLITEFYQKNTGLTGQLLRANAMRYIYEKLKDFYPNARIYFCSPVEGCETVRPYKEILYKRNLMKAICDRIADVTFIDTFSCGICGKYEKDGENGRDLIDGLHPNVSGAKKIGEYNAAAFTESLA